MNVRLNEFLNQHNYHSEKLYPHRDNSVDS